MHSYRVTATREGDWWVLVARDVDGREVASQSRRLDQAEPAIRDAIALVLDTDPTSFALEISPDLESVPMSEEAREVLELRHALIELSERVHRRTSSAVAELRSAGLTVRDVAQLLGVTAARVSQIEQRERARRP